MPLYLRGGVGPLRYSKRISPRRRKGQPSGAAIVGKAVLFATVVIAPGAALHWWSIPVYAVAIALLVLGYRWKRNRSGI